MSISGLYPAVAVMGRADFRLPAQKAEAKGQAGCFGSFPAIFGVRRFKAKKTEHGDFLTCLCFEQCQIHWHLNRLGDKFPEKTTNRKHFAIQYERSRCQSRP